MDLNEFLKKAMEEEMNPGSDIDGDDFDFVSSFHAGSESIKNMISVLSSAKLVTLGKVAVDEKEKVIADLTEYLGKANRNDKAHWTAHAGAKVELAGKKIRILNTIISAATISTNLSGLGDEEDMAKTLKTIVTMNMI